MPTGAASAVLALAGFSSAADLPAAAQSTSTKDLPAVRTATADLNGDDKFEKIAITYSQQNPIRFTLSVNGAKLTEKAQSFDSDTPPGFRVVKIDGAGKARQIAIEFVGPSGMGDTNFYRWDGRAIRRIGAVPNAEAPSGNGAVYGSVYMSFWTCRQKYSLNPKTQTFAVVRQPMYFVGESATVKQSFPILQDHTAGSGAVASVAPSSKIQLVTFWSPAALPENSTKTNGWFLVKTATGLCGWARLNTFEKKVGGLVYGG